MITLIHCSTKGGIKSAADMLYKPNHPEGPLVNYWRYKYLAGKEGTLKDMEANREGRCVFFSLKGWILWPYGHPYELEVSEDTPCFAGLGEQFHILTTVKEAEDVILQKMETDSFLWENLRFMEVVIPVEWLPSDVDILYTTHS